MDINAKLKEVDFNKPDQLGIDKGTAMIAYNKYKGYTLPVIVMVISALMLIFIVIPEINQFFATQKQLDEETQKLNVLKNNYNFLTNLNQFESDKNLRMLTKVLPTEKDFLGIMTSISTASSLSSIAIENYKFSLGNLSKASGETAKYPTIIIDTLLSGSGISLNRFINELYKTAPMVEVTSVKYKDGKVNVKLAFYYKPFPPQNISDESPVSRLSNKEQKIMKLVSLWNNLLTDNQNFLQGANISSSVSGNLNFEATPSSKIETSTSPFD